MNATPIPGDELRQRRQRLLTRLAALRTELNELDAELERLTTGADPAVVADDTPAGAQFPLPIAAG